MIWKKYITQLKLNGKIINIQELLSKNKPDIDNWQYSHFDFLKKWISDQETIQVKTSGSTGNPKIIKIHKDTFVHSALNTGNFFHLKSGNKVLLCLPGTYIAGQIMLVRALVLGLDLYWQKPTSTPAINMNFDFCALTPMQLENILKKDKQSLNKIDKLIIGGAPVSNWILKEISDLNTQIYETYGMTETVSHIALKKINGIDKNDFFTTLPNIEIDIDNRSCLVLKKSNLKTAEIVTNDIIELKDNRHFKWLGRADNIINSGGIKLIPEKIEQKLRPFIENEFFIFAINDKKYGQLPAIVIENSTEDIIPDFSTLDKYEIPKKIFYVKNFLKTTSGKIRRKDTLKLIL